VESRNASLCNKKRALWSRVSEPALSFTKEGSVEQLPADSACPAPNSASTNIPSLRVLCVASRAFESEDHLTAAHQNAFLRCTWPFLQIIISCITCSGHASRTRLFRSYHKTSHIGMRKTSHCGSCKMGHGLYVSSRHLVYRETRSSLGSPKSAVVYIETKSIFPDGSRARTWRFQPNSLRDANEHHKFQKSSPRCSISPRTGAYS